MKRTGVTEQTAARDLTALASAGILAPRGTGRGRHYVAGEPLRASRDRRRATRKPLRDLYPAYTPGCARNSPNQLNAQACSSIFFASGRRNDQILRSLLGLRV